MAYNPPIGSIYHLYTTYILPSGGLYATYHPLGEPETTIGPTGFFTFLIRNLVWMSLGKKHCRNRSNVLTLCGIKIPSFAVVLFQVAFSIANRLRTMTNTSQEDVWIISFHLFSLASPQTAG